MSGFSGPESPAVITVKTSKAKAWTAALALVVVSLTAAFSDDVFSLSETQQFVATLIEAGAGIWAVYQIPNKRTV